MKQLIISTKHNTRNLFRGIRTIKLNINLILIIIIFASFLTVKDKDLSFTVSLKANTSNGVKPRFAAIHMEKDSSVAEASVIPMNKETTKVPKPVNLANTFSNIGFILNPTYAKRNNVNPVIVTEKRKICEAYIKRYHKTAQEEMKKYGIPASITLSQGLLESNAGASRLATLNLNHFGIKCFARDCHEGHCSRHTDDSHKDFFRKYESVWHSYRAHSLFLQRSRYQHLKKLGSTNYKEWAHGLRKAGYATDKKYAPKLIILIETLKLNKYDK